MMPARSQTPSAFLVIFLFFGKDAKSSLHHQSRYPLIVLAPAKPSHKPAVGYPLLSGLACKGSAFYKPSIAQILIAKLTIRQLKQTAIISPTTPISSVRRVKRSISTDSLMERSLQTPSSYFRFINYLFSTSKTTGPNKPASCKGLPSNR